jgi:uncharacterized protein
MMQVPATIKHGAAVIALLLAAGCGSSPPQRYYTLAADQSAKKAQAAQPGATAYTVAVGPVAVSPVVDRPQFVIQVAPNRVALLDEQRWAEPLSSAIPRVVAADLAALLDAPTVVYPQESLVNVKYRVVIEIRNFVSVPGESATIEASWSVFGPHDSAKRGLSFATEPIKEAGYEAVAAAHSRALMSVSRDVAAAIRGEEARQ